VERFRHVTARAVARTGQLARITLPLLEAGGSLQALKGESAGTELEEDADLLRSLGASRWSVSRFGSGIVDPETVVLSVEVDAVVDAPAAHRGGSQPAVARAFARVVAPRREGCRLARSPVAGRSLIGRPQRGVAA
jgi:16S rRNA (guanine527-N7)-methyltransferase